MLGYQKLSERAIAPIRSTPHSVGHDLFSAHNVLIPARQRALVRTDLRLSFPVGCNGRIAPRSGLALKYFLDVGAGVIDPDFQGNVGVLIYNFGDEDYSVSVGDRIAQLICERVTFADVHEIFSHGDLSVRGEAGFGSTGK